MVNSTRNAAKAASPPLQSERGFVYFILSDDLYCKVGKAKDPASRLRGLQTGWPGRLSIHHTIECENYTEAEAFFHFHLWRLRVAGEWFDLSSEFLSRIRTIGAIRNEDIQKESPSKEMADVARWASAASGAEADREQSLARLAVEATQLREANGYLTTRIAGFLARENAHDQRLFRNSEARLLFQVSLNEKTKAAMESMQGENQRLKGELEAAAAESKAARGGPNDPEVLREVVANLRWEAVAQRMALDVAVSEEARLREASRESEALNSRELTWRERLTGRSKA